VFLLMAWQAVVLVAKSAGRAFGRTIVTDTELDASFVARNIWRLDLAAAGRA
jgi:hypothetical protein